MSGEETLTCLTWNLALLARSSQAPPQWTQEHTEATIRELILDWSPDLVLFQELPGIVPFVETHDMVRANPRTHSGQLATLVGNHLLADRDAGQGGGSGVAALPSVIVDGCGLVVPFPELGLSVANVHLAPGRGAAAVRLAQLQSVVAAAPDGELLILGDTNTRTDEEPGIAALGLEAPRPPCPTWDGRRNPFNGPSGEFVAYFTRPLATRGVRIVDQVVRSGRVTEGSRSFHLSDHFALEVAVAIA